jgi:hypothetical protein
MGVVVLAVTVVGREGLRAIFTAVVVVVVLVEVAAEVLLPRELSLQRIIINNMNDKTEIPLMWFFSAMGFAIFLVGGIVLWASGVANTAYGTAAEVTSVKSDVSSLKHDMQKVRESQIRIEYTLGIKKKEK